MEPIDEGYIKYNIHWEPAQWSQPLDELPELMRYRDRMHELKLIGHDTKHNVGYGNISVRLADGSFLVSGTQTGHLFPASENDFTRVIRYSIPENAVWCKGPVKASSESLTHAAVYACTTEFKAIIHVHHKPLWEHLLETLPATSNDVPYGTPEMAMEVRRLYNEQHLAENKIFAMSGHEDGVIATGSSLREAEAILLAHL